MATGFGLRFYLAEDLLVLDEKAADFLFAAHRFLITVAALGSSS